MTQQNFFKINRFPAHAVTIGDRPLGGNNPIRLQSMTNTNTLDIAATVAQCIRIIEAGADYVRISAPNIKAAEALKEIRKAVTKAGFTHPLIADIHYNPDVALLAARYVEKVRINPGNYTGSSNTGKTEFSIYEIEQEKEHIYNRLKPLADICRENGTAIRIGTNMGSLSARIINQYGNTPAGMVQATFEFVEIFEQLNFRNLVVSLKASKPMVMVQAYEGMVERMMQHNMAYPLHIGITEAGEGENGRIKSALGICTLLNKGIGDTLRVSLTEEPECEIPFAIKLSSLYQIPFTSPGKHDAFDLKKSSFQEDPITITPNKHKGIVIGEINSGSSTCLDNEKPQTQTDEWKPENVTHMADFWFAAEASIALKNPENDFLVPFGKIEFPLATNIYPIINNPGDKEIDYEKLANGYFYRVFCGTNKPSEITDIKPGLMGIVADMNTCAEEASLDQWVALSERLRLPIIVRKCFQTADPDEVISHFAIFAGNYLLERKIQGLWITAPKANTDVVSLAFGFLQSAGLRITRTEFISCPTCARTSYDLQKVLHDVQKHTSRFPGLKIAVMGCIVNGPGEMADADFGFVGTGTGKLHLYQGRKPVRKNIEPRHATTTLLELLRENGYDV